MSWDAISALLRKDLTAVARNRGVRLPLILTPIVLLVLLPILLVVGGETLGESTAIPEGTVTPFDEFLPGVEEAIGGTEEMTWERTVLEFFVAPLFLLVPLVVATVIAADSFAGERERRTLEALLHTPMTDEELFVGKLLVAYVPALGVAFVSFAVYSVLANVLGYAAIGRVFFPTPMWLVLAFWVAPAVTALGLVLLVIVSSRVRSLQAAHQIGSLIILPFVLIVVAQVSGLVLFNVTTVVVLGSAVWIAAALLLVVGLRLLDRDRITSRL